MQVTPVQWQYSSKNNSGLYQPTFIDLNPKNGKERFYQIRKSVELGDTSYLLELAFLPMYGNDKDVDRVEFVKEIIKFVQKKSNKRTACCCNFDYV